MKVLKFDWDKEKDLQNYKKHKISFNMAIGAFYDDYRIERFDKLHSFSEDRFILIGKVDQSNEIVFIVYCIREDIIRIISARIANSKERRDYYDSKI